MKLLPILTLLLFTLFSNTTMAQTSASPAQLDRDLVAFLDTIWRAEQEPIRQRDAMMKAHGLESAEYLKYQDIYKRNHQINEKKITELLDTQGWPSEEVIGDQGSLTICNVIQHSPNEVRVKYLPMMRQAVKDQKLAPWLLARTEDRVATERGELQIYGGQIKFYPETQSFNVWPILDPANVDKRRAEIGLEPMADFLKRRRFQVEWNVEEQIKRTAEFLKNKENEKK